MNETEAELAALQQLLDRSAAEARSPMLRNIFRIPKHSLSARQLVKLLHGVRHVALATSGRSGAPRVAPVDGLFFHGKFWISTDRSTARAKDLLRRKELSLTYFEGEDLAIIVHGNAVIFEPGDPEFARIDHDAKPLAGMGAVEASAAFGGSGALWIRVEPRAMFTFARYPEKFAS